MKKLWMGIVPFVLPALLLAACSKNSPVSPQFSQTSGKMNFAIATADNSKSNVVSGQVTIVKGGVTQSQTIKISDHAGTFTFNNIQVGNWDLAVKLFDKDGTEIYTGSGTAAVKKDQTTTVKVHVDQNTGNLKVVVDTDTTTPTPSPTITATPAITPTSGPTPMVERIFVSGYRGMPVVSILNSDGSGEVGGNNRYTTDWETNNRGNSLYAYHTNYTAGNVVSVSYDVAGGWDVITRSSQPRFSWQGESLAVNFEGYIVVCSPYGTGQGVVTSLRTCELPCWTPDNRMLFSSQGDIFLMNQLGDNPFVVIPHGHVTDCSVNFKVLYYSDQTGINQVYSANIDGSGVTQLTHAGGNCFNAHYNRACNRIVFQADDGIWTMDENGGALFHVSTSGRNPFFVY